MADQLIGGIGGTPESLYFTLAEIPTGTIDRFIASKDLGVTWHKFEVWRTWPLGVKKLCRFRGFCDRASTVDG